MEYFKSCFFEAGLTEELLEYERKLHRTLEIPMRIFCAYNTEIINRIGMKELQTDLIQEHG